MRSLISFHRRFSTQIALRLSLLLLCCGAATWLMLRHPAHARSIGVLATAAAVLLVYRLGHYVNDTNRRLARFFESVQYHDFAVQFTSGQEKGESFVALNRQLNAVLQAFRLARAEKESNLIFLNTVVQHLSTGVIAYNAEQKVVMVNSVAYRLLNLRRLSFWEDVKEQHPALWQFANALTGRDKLLYHPMPAAGPAQQGSPAPSALSVQANVLQLQGQRTVLLTFQNIHDELQGQQLDAWRHLTRVLRHEMMNSLTPILTLAETMRDMVRHDLPPGADTADLEEAIEIIASRSRGLMEFVNVYREYSALPQPHLQEVQVKKLIERTAALALPDLRKEGIQLEWPELSPTLLVQADPGQMEMILLNLLKNAKESILAQALPHHGRIRIGVGQADGRRLAIEITDNGIGIAPDLIQEIFVPFFTTKPTGAGIGLSISLQIMHQHGGDLHVHSEMGNGSTFTMLLPA